METLETLARRIATTQSLATVVRTMKSLSLVKVRQFERAHRAISVHDRVITLGLQALLMGHRTLAVTRAGGAEATGAVIVGSDHGLCGRFNDEVVALAQDRLGAGGSGFGPIAAIAVGHRLALQLEASGRPAEVVLAAPNTAAAIAETTGEILVAIDRWRAAGAVTRVVLFRNVQGERGSAGPREVRILPVDEAWLAALAAAPWPARGLPTYTMDFERLFAVLLRRHVFVTLYRSIAESLVSEHATRLRVMQAAERNIREHLDEMNADFRRLRQASITAELLDAIAGYEALRAA